MTTRTERLKKLFVGNPMKMEVVRFRRRFLHSTGSTAYNRALLGTVIFAYLAIIALVFMVRKDLNADAVVAVQAVLLLIIAPLVAHGAIAGERDRRSWDLLEVAPVSHGQIVVGKFYGLLSVLLTVSLAFLPAVLIAVTFGQSFNLWTLLLMEGVSLTSASAVAAFTLFLSSRLKSANATLAVSIASTVGTLVILPMGVTLLTNESRLIDVLMVWHPLYVLIRLSDTNPDAWQRYFGFMNPLFGLPQIVLYSLFTLACLGASTRTLHQRAGKE